jgi:transcriptional regulator with XRE-family HTH domain
MTNAYFDLAAFMQAVDKVRRCRGRTWYQIAHETGVAASSLSQILHYGRSSITSHTLAALALWADVDVRPFMKVREEAT